MDLLVIDCQNDFVDGALAAVNGKEAIEKIVDFLNTRNDLRVFYSLDYHPTDHCSFKDQGGPWPPHCVGGSFGARIHEDFNETAYKPDEDNMYLKGQKSDQEEYSAFDAKNKKGKLLRDDLENRVYIVGIASEYCVRETALDLQKAGKDVVVLKDLLGYIDYKDHLENLKDLEDKGIGVE